MTAPPLIKGMRVTLRPLSADDADALFPLYGDATAMKWWSHAPHADVAETRAALEDRCNSPDWRTWAIIETGDDRAIGTVGALEKRQGKVVEIGYSLVPARWGRGLARDAVALVIDHLFRVEGHRRIVADTDPDNAASNALLTRLGFTVEGRLRGEWETHIGVRDSLIWGLMADEWQGGM